MKLWELILLVIGVAGLSFSYGYSISPECKSVKVAEYQQIDGQKIPLLKLSEIVK